MVSMWTIQFGWHRRGSMLRQNKKPVCNIDQTIKWTSNSISFSRAPYYFTRISNDVFYCGACILVVWRIKVTWKRSKWNQDGRWAHPISKIFMIHNLYVPKSNLRCIKVYLLLFASFIMFFFAFFFFSS